MILTNTGPKGLTKRFRLPGWRIAWVIGPKEFIKAIGSCGSYLDGGANVPFQEAAIPMLEPNRVLNEMKALQTHFLAKRDFVLGRLKEIGFKFSKNNIPDSTFYIWLDLSCLPAGISDGLNFFQVKSKHYSRHPQGKTNSGSGVLGGEGHRGAGYLLRLEPV